MTISDRVGAAKVRRTADFMLHLLWILNVFIVEIGLGMENRVCSDLNLIL